VFHIFRVVFSHLTNGVHPRDVAIPFFFPFFLVCVFCFARGICVTSGIGLTTLTNKKRNFRKCYYCIINWIIICFFSFSFNASRISDGHSQHQGRRWHCQASGYIAELFLGTGCNRDKADRGYRPTLTWSEGSIPTPRRSCPGRWVRFHDWMTPPYLARLGDSATIKKLFTKSINSVRENSSLHYPVKLKISTQTL